VFPVGYILVAHLKSSIETSQSFPTVPGHHQPTTAWGSWVYANKQALRIGAVVLASLALVFWSQPTGKVVLLLAGLLLVALALIELLGRPPNAPSSPPQPERDPGCGSSTPKRVYHCRVG
jgi:hypothetical protein